MARICSDSSKHAPLSLIVDCQSSISLVATRLRKRQGRLYMHALPGALKVACAQIGVGQTLMATPRFWLQLLLVYIIAFSLRVVERAARWLFFPNDNMVLAEIERVVRKEATTVIIGLE